jgi:hypothetical protein
VNEIPDRVDLVRAGPSVALKTLIAGVNLGLAVFIFYLGTLDGGPNVQDLPGKDKLGHALAFGLLALTQLWALRAFGFGARRSQPFLAASASTALGAVLELVQLGIPTRTADWFDLLADAVGAGVVVLVVSVFDRPRTHQAPEPN